VKRCANFRVEKMRNRHTIGESGGGPFVVGNAGMKFLTVESIQKERSIDSIGLVLVYITIGCQSNRHGIFLILT
jgi:hypothetical protein